MASPVADAYACSSGGHVAAGTWIHALANAARALGARQAVDFTDASINTEVSGMCPTEGQPDLVAIDWSVKGEWDAVGQQALFACSPAGMLTWPDASILLRYQAQSAQWSALHEPWAGKAFGHGYDGTAFDPVDRVLYRHLHYSYDGSQRLLRWDVANWQALPVMNTPPTFGLSWEVDCALAWFDTWGAEGGLAWCANNGGRLAMWDKATDAWTLEYDNPTSWETNETVSHYHPLADRLVFGSAQTGGTLFIMDPDGNVIETNTTPCPVRASASPNPGAYGFVPDPGGLESLVFSGTAGDRHIFGLNLLTGAWADHGQQSWMNPTEPSVAFSIPEHNVIMIVRHGLERTNKVYLYKHSP